jgi:hypothetical protein
LGKEKVTETSENGTVTDSRCQAQHPLGCSVPAALAQHQFRAGLWQADTDEITHENVWEKNYTVQIPTKDIDILPSGDIDAYTDGSLMRGKSGAGAFILNKSGGERRHFCSLRGNTKQATVF